jgi:hypothetical protein
LPNQRHMEKRYAAVEVVGREAGDFSIEYKVAR